MLTAQIESTLLEVAHECLNKGPGYSQESVVLREMQNRMQPQSLEEQQQILDAWHRLFADGKLVWGYNLENPRAPFFHIPVGA